jgi:hypothetical protein
VLIRLVRVRRKEREIETIRAKLTNEISKILEAFNESTYCVYIRTLNLRSELEYSARRIRISSDLLTKPYILIGSSVTLNLRYVRIHYLYLSIGNNYLLSPGDSFSSRKYSAVLRLISSIRVTCVP